jgi:integrase
MTTVRAQPSTQPFQVLVPTGSITVHLDPRSAGGVLHWRYWDSTKANWRTGSTHETRRREAMTAAQEAILRLTAHQADDRAAWSLADACNDCLRDRFPEAAVTAAGPALHQLPKHLPKTSPQWYTYRDARQRLQRFVAATGSGHAMGSVDVFSGWCQSFLGARRAAGITPQGLSNDQRALSRLASWMMSRRPPRVDWPHNPAARTLLDLPPLVKKIPQIPQAVAVDRFLKHIRATDVYPAVLLILSGLRPSGSGRIEWTQVDFTRSAVTSREKNVERLVRLNRWAAGELRRWHQAAGQPTGAVWPFGSSYLFMRFRRLRDAAGCPGLTMQGLRRHISQRLYGAGVAPQIEAKILGHSVSTAMRHYVDLAQLDEHPDVEAALDFGKPPRNRSKDRSKGTKAKRSKRRSRAS